MYKKNHNIYNIFHTYVINYYYILLSQIVYIFLCGLKYSFELRYTSNYHEYWWIGYVFTWELDLVF